MSNPVLLSGSSLNVWVECPREWEYAYLWALERPPSLKMARGTAGHEAVEVAMRHYLEHGEYPPDEKWEKTYLAKWKTETVNSKPLNDKPEEQPEALRDRGLKGVLFYAHEIAPTIVPYATEMPVRFTINGHVWTGTIDLLQRLSGAEEPLRVALRDHKFTAKRPENPRRYRWPMVGYAIGLRRELDIVEEDVILDHVILNQKPVHFPVSTGGAVTDTDIIEFAQEIENAMAAIGRGSFPPLGRETGACNWCPYWDICPDYKGRKRVVKAQADSDAFEENHGPTQAA